MCSGGGLDVVVANMTIGVIDHLPARLKRLCRNFNTEYRFRPYASRMVVGPANRQVSELECMIDRPIENKGMNDKRANPESRRTSD